MKNEIEKKLSCPNYYSYDFVIKQWFIKVNRSLKTIFSDLFSLKHHNSKIRSYVPLDTILREHFQMMPVKWVRNRSGRHLSGDKTRAASDRNLLGQQYPIDQDWLVYRPPSHLRNSYRKRSECIPQGKHW